MAVLSNLPDHQKLDRERGDTQTYYIASVKTRRRDGATYRVVVTSLSGTTTTSNVVKADAVVRRWNPEHVLLVGIAGGIEGEVALGDVIVASKAISSEQRWAEFPADEYLLNAAENLPHEWEDLIGQKPPEERAPRRHCGIVAFGGDITASKVMRRIAGSPEGEPKLVGVERAGVAAALYNDNYGQRLLMIRGVSYFTDCENDAEIKSAWRSYACDVAAAYLVGLLRSGPVPGQQYIADAPFPRTKATAEPVASRREPCAVPAHHISNSLDRTAQRFSPMNILSAFLSHSSTDKSLVEAVAKQLAWRGIRPWLDSQELPAGIDLNSWLSGAVKAQRVLVLFMSQAAMASSWVRGELDVAIELERDGRKESIIPVFLDDYESLVRTHDILCKRWMNPEQTQVTRLGIKGHSRQPHELAERIADAIYCLAKVRSAAEVAVIVDQRGSGSKRGDPALPNRLEALDAPALLFRPELGERTQGSVVDSHSWHDCARAMTWALQYALELSGVHRQHVHWFGQCQMALAALFGWVVDRSSGKRLTLYDRNNVVNLNLEQQLQPLQRGNSYAPEDGARTGAAAIILATPDDGRRRAAEKDAQDRGLLVAQVPAPTNVVSGDQVVEMARDVTATFNDLKDKYGVTKLYMYNLSAAYALAGISSYLLHVVDSLTVLELPSSDGIYEQYSMPTRS